MAKFSVETTIHAPREDVFALASDFANAGDVIEGIAKVEMLSDGPVAVGTRFRETRVMFGREAVEEMEVVAMDAPRSYALLAESHGARYYSEFTFEQMPDATLVRMTFDAQPLTRFAKVMAVLTKPLTKKLTGMLLCDLTDLKTAAEGRATG